MTPILRKIKDSFKDPITAFVVFPLIIGIVVAIYYFFDTTYWNSESYGPGTVEDQIYESQDSGEFYAP